MVYVVETGLSLCINVHRFSPVLILTQKGGVGKTTTATTLAYLLSVKDATFRMQRFPTLKLSQLASAGNWSELTPKAPGFPLLRRTTGTYFLNSAADIL